VRITVKLRPDEHDELFRHVRRIGSTMSEFYERAQQGSLRRTDFWGFRGLIMRSRLLYIAFALLVCSEASALAQCDDKSQQNAADEAGIKGDLGAASKCATQADKEQSEKKLEDAAARAKDSVGTDGATPPLPAPVNR
jgi:hypothetical protein